VNYILQYGVNATTTLMRRVLLGLLVYDECKMIKVNEDTSSLGRAISV
jgi:hypothetical protein